MLGLLLPKKDYAVAAGVLNRLREDKDLRRSTEAERGRKAEGIFSYETIKDRF